MFRLKSKIDINSQEFKNNKKQFVSLLDEYKSILKENTCGGSKRSVAKHKERGKLLARERINLLLDPNTPFLELSPLAAYNQYNNGYNSAGIVTGIGVVHGRETMIIANDATVKGGSYMHYTVKKHLRAQEIALENFFAICLSKTLFFPIVIILEESFITKQDCPHKVLLKLQS